MVEMQAGRRGVIGSGLEIAIGAFVRNAISLEHHPELDADALKELGVAAMGHRLTLLSAAADYVPTRAATPSPEAAAGL